MHLHGDEAGVRVGFDDRGDDDAVGAGPAAADREEQVWVLAGGGDDGAPGGERYAR